VLDVYHESYGKIFISIIEKHCAQSKSPERQVGSKRNASKETLASIADRISHCMQPALCHVSLARDYQKR
jgi:hypothetical protein